LHSLTQTAGVSAYLKQYCKLETFQKETVCRQSGHGPDFRQTTKGLQKQQHKTVDITKKQTEQDANAMKTTYFVLFVTFVFINKR